ncbi:hypothetical protein MVEN_01296400 [Mycena venus]|uniref:Uncharacterized protein n=1 Tax=Mycena venus TaxID=2733690 RepID=A0A8H6XXB2_9AGAR|nr:hypothetical protein MVEN_01296400 [Mycena venus]
MSASAPTSIFVAPVPFASAAAPAPSASAPPPTPSASASSVSTGPIQRTDTVLLAPTPDAQSTDDQDSINLHDGNPPLHTPVVAANGGSISSASPSPFLPPGPTAAQTFMSDVGLRPLIADDKKLESKPEIRGLQREIHGIVQSVASHIRLSTDTAITHGNAIGVLQNNLNDISSRLSDVTATLQRIEARQALLPAPAPVHDVAGLLAELTTTLKRARSPDPVRDGRVVRAHIDNANASPSPPCRTSHCP